MLLKSLRFVFLAALSVHAAGGIWFFLSCHNTVDMHTPTASLLHEDDHHEACMPDTWGNHEGITLLSPKANLSTSIHHVVYINHTY